MYSREEAVAIDAEASLSGSDSEQEGQQQEGQQRWGWTGSAKGEGGEAVEILELMRSVTGGFLRGDEERVLSNYAGVQASRRLGVFACVGAKRGGVCGCVWGGGGVWIAGVPAGVPAAKASRPPPPAPPPPSPRRTPPPASHPPCAPSPPPHPNTGAVPLGAAGSQWASNRLLYYCAHM